MIGRKILKFSHCVIENNSFQEKMDKDVTTYFLSLSSALRCLLFIVKLTILRACADSAQNAGLSEFKVGRSVYLLTSSRS